MTWACKQCGGAMPTRLVKKWYSVEPVELEPRRDAWYCSSACRQKAYRARQRERAAAPRELPGQLDLTQSPSPEE